MPKQRITKDMVVDAAFTIARQSGMEQVLVKSIADKLGCSVQPIYSYCKNMNELREEVSNKAREFIKEYIVSHIDKSDLFRSTGRAYIQLAKEEPHILKIFILQERRNISSLKDIYEAEATPQITQALAKDLDIGIETARQLHLNMLIYTIGLGTIFSVSSPGIPIDEIFLQQEQAHQAFVNNALRKRN
ncbi:MAG: TetR/AcrR family transcriptional regulator [Acutalibacteraceae bacterium]